jgi:hypothetical protein
MAFTEHDLEHQRLKVQVLLLQQLVLKLFVVLAKDRTDGDLEGARSLARKLVDKSSGSLSEFPQISGLTDAEHAMFIDEHSEVFDDLKQHLDFILQGAL